MFFIKDCPKGNYKNNRVPRGTVTFTILSKSITYKKQDNLQQPAGRKNNNPGDPLVDADEYDGGMVGSEATQGCSRGSAPSFIKTRRVRAGW